MFQSQLRYLSFVLTVILCGLSISPVFADRPRVIHHQGFQDFSKGSFADGGANIYVSRGGVIQLIPRWDLNRDGYLDLVFNQDHNLIENVDAFIHWGSPQGYHSLFPAFWKEVPAFKLVRTMQQSRQHISHLPTFGGGPVKLVDLNRDDYVDIVFPNTIHNYYVDLEAYIYWGGPDGYSSRRRTELPTLFAADIAVEDLNRDDYPDLVFSNYGDESGDRFGYRNHRYSWIYWGAPDGFSARRRTQIPTLSARSCAAGDFNGDRWPDLAFANNNAKHQSLYVYFGGKEGFSTDSRLILEGGDPRVVRTADLNGDGSSELIVCAHQETADVYFGSQDFQLENPLSLPANNSTDAVAADFDQDGHLDIAFASGLEKPHDHAPGEVETSHESLETESAIFWGSAGGLDAQRYTLLPTLSPAAVAAQDLNGDGFPEVIFANEHDGTTYDVPSYIYWGSRQGFDPSNRKHLQGFGPVGVGAADLNRDGQPEVVLMNQLSGRRGGLPSVIFWGNQAHHYSEAGATLLHAERPYFSKVADFNDDGYPDVVFSGSSIYIYWGGPQGFVRHTVLDVTSHSIAVGDFNHDGYLDMGLVTTFYDDRSKTHGRVVWGSQDGFSIENSTKLNVQAIGSGGVATADLNRDGYLDLVFCSGETPSMETEIMWGHPDGFGSVPSTLLKTNGVAPPAFADLDGNGWLEMILPGSNELREHDPHTETLIYWGSEQGFSDERRTGIESFTSLEVVVDDFNRDGYLDIASGNYKASHTRSLPVFIYWGNAAHQYSSRNRTELPAESSCGMQVLDLNQDNYPDLIVHNHIKDGDHTYGAYIYWGHSDGYSTERRDHLPTMGTHFALGISPGSIYDRSPNHDYLSPLVEVPAGTSQMKLTWEGQTPHKTAIGFAIRSGENHRHLSSASWAVITPGKLFPVHGGSRLLQYRARLVSPGGGNSPLLRQVTLEVLEEAPASREH